MAKTTPYIPNVGVTYPDDPFVSTVPPVKELRHLEFDGDYPYDDRSLSHRISRFICYAGVFLVAFPLNRLLYGVRVKGRKNLKPYKKILREKKGITVCNHVYRFDMLCVARALRFHTFRFPSLRQQMLGKEKWFIKSMGGTPVPESREGLRAFNEAFDAIATRSCWIHVFPEARRWEFYPHIRPFKIGAFNMAWKYDRPIVPLTITYRERKGIYKLFAAANIPLVTINVGTPIIPDKTVRKNIDSTRMRDEAHAQMCAMTGFESNPWPSAID